MLSTTFAPVTIINKIMPTAGIYDVTAKKKAGSAIAIIPSTTGTRLPAFFSRHIYLTTADTMERTAGTAIKTTPSIASSAFASPALSIMKSTKPFPLPKMNWKPAMLYLSLKLNISSVSRLIIGKNSKITAATLITVDTSTI